MEHTTTPPPGEEMVGSGAESGRQAQEHEHEPLMLPRKMINVMVALDDSDGSFYALNWALANLLKPKTIQSNSTTTTTTTTTPIEEEGCMVYLVHVQHPFNNYVYPAGAGLHTDRAIDSDYAWGHKEKPTYIEVKNQSDKTAFAASSVVESVKKAQAEVSAKILQRAISICKQNMVRAETLIFQGDPKDEICKAAEQTHVDMLVIGSRGLGGLKRAFLGSVSDYCAHHACCPVLIVKPPKHIK